METTHESHTAVVCGKAITDVAEQWMIREHIQAVRQGGGGSYTIS